MTSKEYYQKNKEHINALRRQRYKENPTAFKLANKRYKDKNREIIREKQKEYYKKHKDTCLEQQKQYRNKNRAAITKSILKRRKEVAQELKEKGQIWTYLPKSERENKMCQSLAKKKKISLITARELLEKQDWNYKKVIDEIEKCSCCDCFDLKEYMFENEDGVYCELCWESRN